MKKNFEKFIISEATKIAKDEKLNFHLKEEKQKLHECDCGCGQCSKEEVEPQFMKIEFEQVNSDEFAEEAVEVKHLSEELGRMKQLLNFNNPLLKS